MPKMNIVKEKIIKATPEQVYEKIADLHHWVHWSPWLIMEPAVQVTIADDGQSYQWAGNRTGSGNMRIIQSEKPAWVSYDLNFIKPWKSHALVKFEVEPHNQGSLVKWHMDSSLPLFMFWMKKSMEAYVGMDYDRGLALLKDYVEDGEVHSKLNFLGEEEFPGSAYIGIRRKSTMEKVGPDMQSDFGKLGAMADQYETDMTQSFSIYHKYNPVKNRVEYTAGIKVLQQPESLPSDFISGSLAPATLYTLEHVGPYEHLGNAWSTLQSMIRNKEIKVIRGYHPFETYGNNPEETNPNDLITRIHFAVKG